MKVVFIRFNATEPVTGGEKQFYNIKEFLKVKKINLEFIDLAQLPFSLRWFRFLSINYFVWRKITEGFYEPTVLMYSTSQGLCVFLASAFFRLFTSIKLIMLVLDANILISSKHSQIISRFINGICFLTAHKILCNSDSTARAWKVSNKKMCVIPPGVNKPKGIRKSKKNLNPEIQSVNILFVGQWKPVKGLIYLIKAADILKNDKFYFHIVGDYSRDLAYKNTVQNYINQHLPEGEIHVYDQINFEKLETLYSIASIVVIPSLMEGYSMVLREAMLRGVPVIATNVGAISELIKNEVNGLLVPSRNSIAIANAIERLLADDKLRKELIENGYKSAERSLTWEEHCEQVYQNILELC